MNNHTPLRSSTFKHRKISGLLIIVILSFSVLTGCRHSSDDNEPNNQGNPPTVENGVLNHGTVIGLTYETNTLSGETGYRGTFEFIKDETIQFKVGDIEIASIPAYANITMLDFDPAYDRDGDSFVPGDRAINILQFLHTISNSSNRHDIFITSEIHTAATGQTINFDQSNEEFSTDLNVIDVVNRLTMVRTEGTRELIDPFKVQISLTENLSFRFGDDYIWEDILHLEHGNQWNYTSQTVKANETITETVSSFALESAWHDKKIRVHGWSDNWRPNQYLYFTENLFDTSIHLTGFQDATGVETILENGIDIFDSLLVPNKWLVYRAYNNGAIVPAHIKIEHPGEMDISGTNYSDLIKYTVKLPESNTVIERWYKIGVGMVKEISTSDISQQIVELTSLTVSEQFPNNETINKFLGLHYLYDYIILGNNEVFDLLEEANSAALLIYLIKGDIGSPSHIEAFHKMYYAIMSAHALALVDKIIEFDNDYGLDSDTTGNLINVHYNETALYILLFATLFDFESSELTEAVTTNLHDIYQAAIDLLVTAGHMEPFELYLYTE